MGGWDSFVLKYLNTKSNATGDSFRFKIQTRFKARKYKIIFKIVLSLTV